MQGLFTPWKLFSKLRIISMPPDFQHYAVGASSCVEKPEGTDHYSTGVV